MGLYNITSVVKKVLIGHLMRIEVLSLLGDKLGIKRSRDQVIEATNHRITCQSSWS